MNRADFPWLLVPALAQQVALRSLITVEQQSQKKSWAKSSTNNSINGCVDKQSRRINFHFVDANCFREAIKSQQSDTG